MLQQLDDLPAFPALSRVLVVESRHGVRTEVLKSIAASRLFTEVVEPESMADALNRIANEEFDACIIGSSVRNARKSDFLQRATERTHARDCAFVVFIKEGEEQPALPDAHKQLTWPCSRRTFTEGVVTGVLSANALTPWATKVLQMAPELGRTLKPRPARKKTTIIQPRTEPQRPDASLAFTDLLAGKLADLQGIVDAIRKREIGLDPSGGPDRLAKIAMNQVVTKIFSQAAVSPKTDQFREFFVYCLHRWFAETVNRGEGLATRNLRERLTAYLNQFTNADAAKTKQ